ncbi:MAG: MOSC domain-containing protein [Chloroflexi bacterium]|nr:MOSC domain-containing protein [Chloroflexota bacterium]
MPTLSSLDIYPVKSLRGQSVDTSQVERMGLVNDRRLMVVNPDGLFLTQREHARMALVTPILKAGMMTLTAAGMQDVSFALSTLDQHINVEIWSSRGVDAIDQGNLAAEWLSDFLKMPTRLVRIDDNHPRQVSAEYAIQADDQVGFADGFPILVITQESLDDLNSRLEKPIPMNRFRPNIVISGATSFAEDDWKRIRIGQVELGLVKPCARCNVPTIDQDTAEKGKEPNTTLAKYRKINGKIMFGVNAIPITTGQLRVGDSVEILD